MERLARFRGFDVPTIPRTPTIRPRPARRRAGAYGVLGTLLLLLLLAPAPGPAGRLAAAEKLIPASFRPINDVHGFAYTCDMHGRVQTQYGWLYSGFTLNRSGMSAQRRLMKPNGEEFVLEGRVGAIAVQRRFKVDRKLGGVRVVEVLTNTSAQPQQAAVVVYAQLNRRYQRVVTNRGRAVSGILQKKETGVAGLMQSPVRGAVLYKLCGASSKVKPSVLNSNNQSLQFHYNVQVPARSKIAIVHGGVILRQASTPPPSAVEKYFKPFRHRRWTGDLPKDVKRALVNTRSRGGGDDGSVPSIEQVFEVPPTSMDQLAFSDTTLLQGSASCTRLEVVTAHGRVKVPFDRVAGIVGARHKTLEPRVHLRDGQKLVGAIDAEELRFEMSSGMAIDLAIDKVDRLVMRTAARAADEEGGPGDGPPAAGTSDVAYLVETFEGNRLRTQRETDAFRVATQWGEMTIPIEELRRIYLAGDEQPGYWVELTDSSRFRAFLRGDAFRMKSDLFGSITFRPHQLRRIHAVRRKRRGQEDDGDEVIHPHLVLAGGDLFVGRIDLDALHFLAPGGTVPQPPSQIRELHNELDGERPGPGETLRFRAEVWGGGHITGELRELVVPVETARGTLRVPVRDIVDVLVPTPIVPEVLRVRLRGLVNDLGHPSWEKREAASRALEDLGELAKQSLQQSLRETKDPEVERRIRRLLDKL